MIPSYLYINEAINERFEEEIPVQSDSFKTLYYNENLYLSTRISDIRKTNNIHKCIRQLLRIGCELRILGVEISTIKKYQFSNCHELLFAA